MLNAAGRTTLTQTTLSAIPVHISITCCLLARAIAEINKRRKAFLWTRNQSTSRGKCKIAWPIICSPGGLGIPDLKLLGFVLRLMWEWLRRTNASSAWAPLPSRAEKNTDAMFRVSISVRLGDGASARFWTDSWLPDGPISSFAPSLFQVVGRRRRNHMINEAPANRSWVRDISGAPTAPVLCDYVLLWEKLERVPLQPTVSDCFVWKWTGDGKYSASSAYRSFFIGRMLLVGAEHLWHAHAPPKVKFFFWVALHGRLWTAARQKRHGLHQDASCVLCA
jgi:hypothetical protein